MKKFEGKRRRLHKQNYVEKRLTYENRAAEHAARIGLDTGDISIKTRVIGSLAIKSYTKKKMHNIGVV